MSVAVAKLPVAVQSSYPTIAEVQRDLLVLEIESKTPLATVEILALTVSDVDLEQGTVTVRRRPRHTVPLTREVVEKIAAYLKTGRPYLVQAGDPTALFLSDTGGQLTYDEFAWSIDRPLRAGTVAALGGIEVKEAGK